MVFVKFVTYCFEPEEDFGECVNDGLVLVPVFIIEFEYLHFLECEDVLLQLLDVIVEKRFFPSISVSTSQAWSDDI